MAQRSNCRLLSQFLRSSLLLYSAECADQVDAARTGWITQTTLDAGIQAVTGGFIDSCAGSPPQ